MFTGIVAAVGTIQSVKSLDSDLDAGVRLETVDLPWQLFALVEGDVQTHLDALRPLCEAFAYASLSLAGRERPALLIRAASATAPYFADAPTTELVS